MFGENKMAKKVKENSVSIVTRRYKIVSIDYEQARQQQLQAARVYNFCIQMHEYCRSYDVWLSKFDMFKVLKKQFEMNSQSIKEVCVKFYAALDGAVTAKKKGEDNKLPWRFKKYYAVPWIDQSIHQDGCNLRFSTGMRGKEKTYLYLKTAEPIPKTKYLELVWDRGYYYLMVTQEVVNELEINSGNVVGIDPGEIHCMTLTDGNESLIITGRGMRSIKQHRAKSLAELSQKMSKCTKYSKRWKRLNRAKRRFLTRSNNLIKNQNHQATRKAVDWAKQHDIQIVVMGNPEGVKDKNCGKVQNQKLSLWQYGKIADYMKYKLI
jgi:putative transposase